MNRLIVDESPGAIAGGVPQTQPPPLAPAVRTAPAPEPIDPDVENSPEFLEAQAAQAKLSKKAAAVAAAKAARAAILDEHRTMANVLAELQDRRARGAREIVSVESQAHGKHLEAEARFGLLSRRQGEAAERMREFLELTAIADGLKGILGDLDQQITAQAAAVEEYAKEHGI